MLSDFNERSVVPKDEIGCVVFIPLIITISFLSKRVILGISDVCFMIEIDAPESMRKVACLFGEFERLKVIVFRLGKFS